MLDGQMQGFHYKMIERLPAGGMCDVFLAHRPGDPQPVVIKILNAQHRQNPDSAEKFCGESDVLGMLDHPNIVRRIEVGQHRDTPYLVLEHVAGVSLRQLIHTRAENEGPLPVTLAAYIGQEVLKALSHVHRATSATGHKLGLVHRDVTPSNIMLGFAGEVRLLDFGIAVAANIDGEHEALAQGKLAYLSPEQVLCEALDRRSDLYAVGAMLYELTTLEPAFGAMGEEEEEVLRHIVDGQLLAPRKWIAEIDRGFEKIILRAMARRRGRRYPRAEDMAIDLGDFLDPMIDGATALATLLDHDYQDHRVRMEALYQRCEQQVAHATETTLTPSS